MADSKNIKAKKTNTDFDSDVDALPDEAQLSVAPADDQMDDDATLDRLLMDAGFDADEKFSESLAENAGSADYDEFGDDFDLADISTDSAGSATDMDFAGDIQVDNDFPLELIESLDNLPDEPQHETFVEDGEGPEMIQSDGLPDDDSDPAGQEQRVVDDDLVIDNLDEFADVDERYDAEQPQKEAEAADNSALSMGDDRSENQSEVEVISQAPAMAFDENELIVDTAEMEVNNQVSEYDEFGDDLNDVMTNPATELQTEADEFGAEPADTGIADGISSAEFDITADPDEVEAEQPDQSDREFDDDSLEQHLPPAEIAPEASTADDAAEKSSDSVDPVIDPAELAALMQFKTDQEALNKKNKKQISEFEKKTKKSTVITYVATGFGVTSLITAIVMGVIAYNAKTEITKLTELTAGLTTDNQAVTAAQPEPGTQPSEHVPVQPAAPAAELTEQQATNPQEPDMASAVKPLSENEPIKPDTGTTQLPVEQVKNTETGVATPRKPDALNGEFTKASDSVYQTVKQTQPEPTGQQKVSEHHSVVSELNSGKASSAISEPSAVREKPTESEHKPQGQDEEKTAVTNVRKKAPTFSKKARIKTKPKPARAIKDWSVNLIAYRQQWYAGSKAAEFVEKGIPVEVLPVKIDNVTWYRLHVGGFNSKEEAALYAGRVKKALNLSSVWVGH